LLDTKAYEQDCVALFGTHAHRNYPAASSAAAVLARTRELYEIEYGAAPPEELWASVPPVPALLSISDKLVQPLAQFPKQAPHQLLSAVEDEELEWLGAAVAVELPQKQQACKHAEPLQKIAIREPSAAVVEYKRFLRMMIDESGSWFTPSKLVDELWHRHMLDTVEYCSFCERVAGSFLHHTPHYGEPHSFHGGLPVSGPRTLQRDCRWPGHRSRGMMCPPIIAGPCRWQIDRQPY
jgi:hypothetical protein